MIYLFEAWGYASPHGLFKRGKDLGEDYQNEELLQLLEEVGEQLNTHIVINDTIFATFNGCGPF